ncbi:MAG: DUF2796 domain-containing protein [Xanthomonadales bacterium]|nr:DUF2796 domain-containing protein [Xanthomonadales bacterium]
MHRRNIARARIAVQGLLASWLCLLLPLAVAASDSQPAQEEHDHEHEGHEHGAHVHGASQLNIALDGKQLSLQLRGALHNFVGFEHAPETVEETAALNAVNADLRNTAGLVLPASAKCVQASTQVKVPHVDAAPAQDTPANVLAEWQFDCANPEAISSLDFAPWFARFPLTEEIEVQWINAATQGGGELNAESTVVTFTP